MLCLRSVIPAWLRIQSEKRVLCIDFSFREKEIYNIDLVLPEFFLDQEKLFLNLLTLFRKEIYDLKEAEEKLCSNEKKCVKK